MDELLSPKGADAPVTFRSIAPSLPFQLRQGPFESPDRMRTTRSKLPMSTLSPSTLATASLLARGGKCGFASVRRTCAGSISATNPVAKEATSLTHSLSSSVSTVRPLIVGTWTARGTRSRRASLEKAGTAKASARRRSTARPRVRHIKNHSCGVGAKGDVELRVMPESAEPAPALWLQYSSHFLPHLDERSSKGSGTAHAT